MADAHKMNRRGGTAVAAVLVAASLLLSGCAVSRLDLGSGVDARAVLEAVKSLGMVDHLEALQRVADANGGNRASGTSGYEEGSPDHTVVVGGHLDSVLGGPGINDNASGVAAVLETALWMAETGIQLANRVRFAFWGAEEDILNGSQHYIGELGASEIRQTALNLNADMMASPNGVDPVHDGDGSDFFGPIFVPVRRIPA